MNTTEVINLQDPAVQAFVAKLQELLPVLLKTLATALLFIGIAVSIFLFIDYILRSIAIARIARRRGVALWGLAWIPGFRLITLGGIADDHDRKTVGRKHGFDVLLPVLLFICLAAFALNVYLLKSKVAELSAITLANENDIATVIKVLFSGNTPIRIARIVMLLAGSLLNVFETIAIYKLLESCKRKHTFLNMLLYLILPVARPIILIAVSGSDSDKKKKPLPHYEHEKAPVLEVKTEIQGDFEE